jgi:hypothetical protein
MTTSSEASTLQSVTPLRKNDVPYYRHRALLGWMSDQAAFEARASLVEDTQEAHFQVISAARAAIQARPPFVPTNPLLDLEVNAFLEAISARPEMHQIVAGWKWRFAQVDLREVLTFQPIIRVDDLSNRIPSASLSQEQLYELCFPSNELAAPEEIVLELTDSGYIINTLNPNMRITPWHKVGSPILSQQQPLLQTGLPFSPGVPPVGAMIVPFVLLKNPGYLQIVQYRDRYFIRDGYHRAAALLRSHINIVPCIHLEARDPQQVGCLQPGMLGAEILTSEQPPRLVDFWNDAVSCDALYPAKRHVFFLDMKDIWVLR